MMSINREIPTYLTPDEIHQLLDSCNNKRNHLLINLGWQCGARISELLEIKRENIDFDNRLIRLITLKKRNQKKSKKAERTIPIQPELTTEIASFVAQNNLNGDRLFPITRIQAFNIIKQVAKKSNFHKKISPHTLRHSFAVHTLVQGVPLPVVSQLLGHSQISTTLIYLKIISPDIKNLMMNVRF